MKIAVRDTPAFQRLAGDFRDCGRLVIRRYTSDQPPGRVAPNRRARRDRPRSCDTARDLDNRARRFEPALGSEGVLR